MLDWLLTKYLPRILPMVGQGGGSIVFKWGSRVRTTIQALCPSLNKYITTFERVHCDLTCKHIHAGKEPGAD